MKELIGTELVVLGDAPSYVNHRKALVAWTDAIAPMVAGGEVSSKPHQRRLHCTRQFDHLGVQAIDRIIGHQRDLVDNHALITLHLDDEIRRFTQSKLMRLEIQLE